jgi:Zn-dependent protease
VRETFSLGRIAGIRIGVNISVLVIVLIIAGGLALGRFPLVLPGRSTLSYVLAGVVAAVAFLASLLAHELAHALVARRNGIEVEGITLWLLGGVARLKGGARGPGAEFRVAGVGPLTSLVLGVVFGGCAMLATAAGAGGLPVAVLAYLAGINVLLAVFNLVPAAPLDGGRLLRAAVATPRRPLVLGRDRGSRRALLRSRAHRARFPAGGDRPRPRRAVAGTGRPLPRQRGDG